MVNNWEISLSETNVARIPGDLKEVIALEFAQNPGSHSTLTSSTLTLR